MMGQSDSEHESDRLKKQRLDMVRQQIAARGVTSERVLKAMRTVPRHAFVPSSQRRFAYEDYPLPIGYGQTISQPYIVAYMTEQLQLSGHERILEIGTGSGYQAAVLAELADSVFTIEIIQPLCQRAGEIVDSLNLTRIQLSCGDGYSGWPEKAPFDAIMITAAPTHIPQPLLDQLAIGGTLISPVGDAYQNLVLMKKISESQFQQHKLLPVRFVPMTGQVRNDKGKRLR